MNTETSAEIELLDLLIKACRSIRDPHRRTSRTEMAIPAAQWEMKFSDRKKKLSQKITEDKKQEVAVPA